MKKDELVFHYQKSNRHSEIKVDGALGGLSPTGGSLFVSLYTERSAIPQKVVHSWNEDGSLGEEKPELREGLTGVVRSVETTLHMGIEQARSLHEWLGAQIELSDNTDEAKE